jgi:hypothetical protein
MNAAHPANGKQAPRPALAAVHEGPSVMTIEAWMPSEIKGIKAYLRCVQLKGDERRPS